MMDFVSDKWHKRYLKLAKEVAQWSKDPSRKIGAVIIGEKGQILSQGYNGFPRGINDDPRRYEDRETKYKYVVHAEMNAIYNAIANGANTEGSTIYITGLPCCHECAKAVIQTGIDRVIMDTVPADNWEESGNLALSMFNEVGIQTKFIKDGDD